MQKNTSGFSIVELIVVVVVISILATISVVLYSNQKAESSDRSMSTALLHISSVFDGYYTQKGVYPITCNMQVSPSIPCASVSSAYSTNPNIPVIQPSDTPKTIHDKLPAFDSQLSHPYKVGLRTGPYAINVINQASGSSLSDLSYFIFSPDALPGASTSLSDTGAFTFTKAGSSATLTCSFRLREYNIVNQTDQRPHQYILGYYSRHQKSWKFFESLARIDVNVTDWNTSNVPECNAAPITELQKVSV